MLRLKFVILVLLLIIDIISALFGAWISLVCKEGPRSWKYLIDEVLVEGLNWGCSTYLIYWEATLEWAIGGDVPWRCIKSSSINLPLIELVKSWEEFYISPPKDGFCDGLLRSFWLVDKIEGAWIFNILSLFSPLSSLKIGYWSYKIDSISFWFALTSLS